MAIAARILEFWNDGADTGAAGRRRPPVKPAELVYGVDESPPRFMLWMGALQHVLIATTVGMFFPLLVLDAAGASHDTAQNLMSICMLALGLGTILLCLKARGLGSGFLMPASFSGVYFSVSILAAKQGGLPLVAGMTMFAGLVQLSLSRVVAPPARLPADRDRRLHHADERIDARGGGFQPDHRRLGRRPTP